MLPRKALPLALDALKNVSSNVTLTIAGDGMDPEAVRSMIHQRNLENRVFWKGARLSLDELRAAYAEHDAMLFTSLRDSFGSQMLEAMAMGLPVIALDLHGARDFLPSNTWCGTSQSAMPSALTSSAVLPKASASVCANTFASNMS